MKDNGIYFIGTLLGLTAGNFIHQMIGEGLWSLAAERSYLQGVALLTCYLAIKLLK